MTNCEECGCPIENHLRGVGCSTIVGYEGNKEPGEAQGQSFFNFSGEKPGAPILCGCNRGQWQDKSGWRSSAKG